MTNRSTLSKTVSNVRASLGLIADTVFAGLFHNDIDELLPPNVERHGSQLVVKVLNPAENQNRHRTP